MKEYDVDYKDSDIKKAVENTILNPEKLKQQQSSSDSSSAHQVYLHNFHSINIKEQVLILNELIDSLSRVQNCKNKRFTHYIVYSLIDIVR